MFNNNIAIFFPTFIECKKTLNISDFTTYNNFDVATYHSIPIIIIGAGKTNSAISSALFFYRNKIKYPLLTGICGAYRKSGLNIGDVVSIDYDYFVDEANYDGKSITTLYEKGFMTTKDNRATFLTDKNYKIVSSNTVSLIPQLDLISDLYMEKTNAFVENMEGASFGVAANIFNIKPYQIRAVSNYCGDKNKQKWDINKACKSLKNAIELFIDIYN